MAPGLFAEKWYALGRCKFLRPHVLKTRAGACAAAAVVVQRADQILNASAAKGVPGIGQPPSQVVGRAWQLPARAQLTARPTPANAPTFHHPCLPTRLRPHAASLHGVLRLRGRGDWTGLPDHGASVGRAQRFQLSSASCIALLGASLFGIATSAAINSGAQSSFATRAIGGRDGRRDVSAAARTREPSRHPAVGNAES